MTDSSRGGAQAFRDWLARHPLILPIIILALGGVFRFYNLSWDSGTQLHPDERWILMVVSGINNNPARPLGWPGSWSQLLSSSSPLNPHFFAYGSLPFYLLAALGGSISLLAQHVPFLSPWSGVDTYNGLLLLGRGLSGLLDLASLVILFLIAQRVFGYWTAVLSMALASFTVLDIQLSHFYTVDTVLLPLALLALLAAVVISQNDSRAAYLWGGAAFGAAMATKTTALLLFAPLGAAAVLVAWNSGGEPAGGLRKRYASVAERLNSNLLWLLGCYALAALTFVVCEPYAILDRAQLIKDIAQQQTYLVTNNPPFEVPFTIQYANTPAYLYQLKNMLFWTMGIPLALAAFAGVLFTLWRNLSGRVRSDQLVLLIWVIPYFLFVGRFFAKFNRYMLPIMPVMTMLGAALLVWLVQRHGGRLRLVTVGALSAVVAVSFLYSLAYMNIYAHPNTRVAASDWIYAHVPAGSKIVKETDWDDVLPLGVDGHSGSIYPPELNLELYSADDPTKAPHLAQALSQAQYLVISSERVDRAVPRLAGRYPVTLRYYDLLFAGKLGFRLAAHFQQHPQLGPVVVHDYPADESFHVYDHPDVMIFKKVQPLGEPRLAALLRAPLPVAEAGSPSSSGADSRLMLSAKQWAADQKSPTMDAMFPPNGIAMRYPILAWLLALELLGLLAFPLTFLLFSHLLDRGFVIAKTLGLLIVGYLVWILVSLGVAVYDRGIIAAAAIAMALLSIGLGLWRRQEIAAWLRLQWRAALVGEMVFLAGFAAFILLRMWYPDLGHQFSPVSPGNLGEGRMGEKQMELAFLNAIVRSRVFPPYDPFFAHGYINYYYYGFFLVGTLCKLTQIAPATGFNLAIATFFAMLVGNIFSVGLNLTRRLAPGVVAALFVGILGNLNGGWQMIQGLMALGAVHSSFPVTGGIVDVLSGLQQALVAHAPLPPFDFWGPTRIVPGGAITEFPYFTFLFADLHPHLIAYPMTAAALALAVNLLLGRQQGVLRLPLTVLLGGVLLGAIAVTNPWDYPTYLVVIAIGALVGAYALNRGLGWRELARPLLWLVGLAACSAILYLPFKQNYQTVFTTGLGLVRDITPQTLTANGVPADQVHDVLVTPLRVYLEHFGLFLFILGSYLAMLLWRAAGLGARTHRLATRAQFALYYRDRLSHLLRVARAVRAARPKEEPVVDGAILAGFAILCLGLAALQYYLLAFLALVLGLLVLLLLRLGRQLPAAQLFVLALLLIPVLLSAGTQIVFVKDWLANGPQFRMNTIFKFYNQAWILYASAAAAALYYLMTWLIPGDRDQGLIDTAEAVPRRPEAPPRRPFHRRVRVPLPDVLPFRLALREWRSGGRLMPTVALSSAGVGGQAVDPPSSEAATELVPDRAGPTPAASPAARSAGPSALARPLEFAGRFPLWSLALALLLLGSLIYTYAGTISRETYRTAWLPENSVPFTLDGMAFMRTAYPGEYRAINWLNAHVSGAQVIAEADGAYYDWRSRVSMFTGLPTIINGIHEGEQRYDDEVSARSGVVAQLYNTTDTAQARQIIRTYGVRWIYVGFSERQCVPAKQCYARAGLAKFQRMVGHGLTVAYRHDGVTIYRVTGP